MEVKVTLNGKTHTLLSNEVPALLVSMRLPNFIRDMVLSDRRYRFRIEEDGKEVIFCRPAKGTDSPKQILASRAKMALRKMTENRQS